MRTNGTALAPMRPLHQARLLIVEDDPEIATMVGDMLCSHGFAVLYAVDGRDVPLRLADSPIDLVILDLMLPGQDGLTICRQLRRTHDVPVLMLTALGSEVDRVVGLESGADDYLTKPFAPRELLARVRALLRRRHWPDRGAHAEEPSCFVFDGWTVDLLRLTLVSPGQVQVPLTSAEFALLGAFCRSPRQVISRERLLTLVHDHRPAVLNRAVDTLVGRLRQKIEDNPHEPARIKTVRSGGYIFTSMVAAAAPATLA